MKIRYQVGRLLKSLGYSHIRPPHPSLAGRSTASMGSMKIPKGGAMPWLNM